jgi:hypothetical protein
MYETRATGHLKGPTPEQVAVYAARCHLELSAGELDTYVANVTAAMGQ